MATPQAKDEPAPQAQAGKRLGPFGPAPLLIGVIGPRDLPDRERWRKPLRGYFLKPDKSGGTQPKHGDCPENLDEVYPNTPFLLLTSLGSHAEQLAAEVALEVGGEQGASLLVPLPMGDEEAYRDVLRVRGVVDGFDTLRQTMDARRTAAESLWRDDCVRQEKRFSDTGWDESAAPDGSGMVPDRCFPLPLLGGSAGLPDDWKCQLQFLHAGAFIAHHCDLLLVLGDEEPTGGELRLDDPAHIVHFRRTGRFFSPETDAAVRAKFGLDERDIAKMLDDIEPDEFQLVDSLLDEIETGPVHWLRSSGQVDCLIPTAYEKDKAVEAAYRQRVERIRQNINRFNADAVACKREAELKRAKQYLCPWNEWKTDQDRKVVRANDGKPILTAPCASEQSPELQALRHYYAQADTLALHYQTRRFSALFGLLALFGLALAAVCAFGAYAHLTPHSAVGSEGWKAPHYLSLYLLLLGLAYGIYLHARDKHYEQKHQDYRALAEATRVLYFWRLAAVPHLVSDYYLRRQRSELDWIRHAARAWSLRVPPASEPDLATVKQRWVVDQRNWFPKKARENHESHIAVHEWSNGFFLVGVALAAYLVAEAFHRDASLVNFSWLLLLLAPVAIALEGLRRKIPQLIKGLQFPVWQVLIELLPIEKERWPKRVARWLRERLKIETGRDPGKPPTPRWLAVVKRTILWTTNLICLFIGGVFLVFCLINAHGVITWFWTELLQLSTDTVELWIVSIAVTVVIAALLHGYAWKMAFGEQARQYAQMHQLYGIAVKRLDEIGADPVESRRLFEDLGRDALAENADWLLLHRERPMELVKAG